jgi:hypothetical protein
MEAKVIFSRKKRAFFSKFKYFLEKICLFLERNSFADETASRATQYFVCPLAPFASHFLCVGARPPAPRLYPWKTSRPSWPSCKLL